VKPTEKRLKDNMCYLGGKVCKLVLHQFDKMPGHQFDKMPHHQFDKEKMLFLASLI